MCWKYKDITVNGTPQGFMLVQSDVTFRDLAILTVLAAYLAERKGSHTQKFRREIAAYCCDFADDIIDVRKEREGMRK